MKTPIIMLLLLVGALIIGAWVTRDVDPDFSAPYPPPEVTQYVPNPYPQPEATEEVQPTREKNEDTTFPTKEVIITREETPEPTPAVAECTVFTCIIIEYAPTPEE